MTDISASELLTFAQIACTRVRNRYPERIAWSIDDRDDCVQEAALGAFIAWLDARDRDDIRNVAAYCQRAAVRAAIRWLFRVRIGRSVDPAEYVVNNEMRSFAPLRRESRESLLTSDRALLLRSMLALRRRNGDDEAATDVAILRDLLDGVPPARIAERHGLTPQALRMRRARLRARLERIVAVLERWR